MRTPPPHKDRFGLKKTEWDLIQNLVVRPMKLKGCALWLFGSRARGDQKPFSDVDIMFEVSKPLPAGFLSRITETLEESRLPFKVDLVNRKDIAESYRTQVEGEKVEL